MPTLNPLLLLLALPLTLAFDNAPTLDPAIPTMSPHEAPTSDSCVGQCAFHFVDAISTKLGPGKSAGILNLNYNDFLTAFANHTFFENFCETYHSFQYCYSKCSHGYMQELLMRSAEIIDHFCVYNFQAIKNKFPCLATLDKEVSRQCLKGCTSQHDAVVSILQNFKHLALNGDSSQAETYLSKSCEYVTCTLHCDVPSIAHHCDFETADLVINLTRKSFASMESLALDTGAVSKWPAMCADIKTYRLPKPGDFKDIPVPPSDAGEVVIAAGPVTSVKDTKSAEVIAENPSTSMASAKSIFIGLVLSLISLYFA
uniref:CPG4 domain-containing protein n=1 Tax=Panagrellus redivivus TaxID=6233 RepID=A0A7E4VAS2_PANRE